MDAWHFVGDKLRDGRDVPADGETLTHDGPLTLCVSGLHASIRAIDALHYAPTGARWLCRVRCGGETIEDTDKLVCRERTILWRVPCDPMILDFARLCARSVLHLWDAPQVVRDYLDTGDENIRAAALAATRSAAGDAAWVALAAARDAAWDAARHAARASAWVAVAAARDAQNNELERLVNETHNQKALSALMPEEPEE